MPSITTQAALAPDLAATMKWPNIFVDGILHTLAHMHPLVLSVIGVHDNLPQPMTVYVRFTDHCFGDHLRSSEVGPDYTFPWCSPNSKDPRAFNKERYDFSLKLQQHVIGLPNAKVRQSTNQRNFMFMTGEVNSSGEEFALFFNIRKNSTSGSEHIAMNIVSCFPSNNHMNNLISGTSTMRFKVLCGRIHRGEAIRFT